MKANKQEQRMGEIHALLSQDLSYIFGEKESGPNGAKKEFLSKSAVFLKQLGKDMGFSDMRVNTNKAGIACSGEVSLYGIWADGNGLFFEIKQSNSWTDSLLYREISGLKDYTGKSNQWLSMTVFKNMDYESLCAIFLKLCKEENTNAA